jgi:hypothetical protein
MEAHPTPIAVLRALAERQGVTPTDNDLAAVQAFLAPLLERLTEIERALPRETPPAGRGLE